MWVQHVKTSALYPLKKLRDSFIVFKNSYDYCYWYSVRYQPLSAESAQAKEQFCNNTSNLAHTVFQYFSESHLMSIVQPNDLVGS